MTIQQLNYVITIAERGSFNKASEVLYVTQPSLTGSVRELEKELGITIFNRNGRGVTLTNDGAEFIRYARELIQQYEGVLERYGKAGKLKKKFGISTQHYSFAVKSFVSMVRELGTDEYEFSIRETKTREVIEDVSTSKSEVGVLYLSDFNRKVIEKILKSNRLEFHKMIDCSAYVYLWKGHPLAQKSSVRFEDLAPYPNMSFEQGSSESFYFAEEILSTNEFPRTIKVNDRATMLNLMIGLEGYTLCSGIIFEEFNGGDYVAVPFETDEDTVGDKMEIGYIIRKDATPSKMAQLYIKEMEKCLSELED